MLEVLKGKKLHSSLADHARPPHIVFKSDLYMRQAKAKAKLAEVLSSMDYMDRNSATLLWRTVLTVGILLWWLDPFMGIQEFYLRGFWSLMGPLNLRVRAGGQFADTVNMLGCLRSDGLLVLAQYVSDRAPVVAMDDSCV